MLCDCIGHHERAGSSRSAMSRARGGIGLLEPSVVVGFRGARGRLHQVMRIAPPTSWRRPPYRLRVCAPGAPGPSEFVSGCIGPLKVVRSGDATLFARDIVIEVAGILSCGCTGRPRRLCGHASVSRGPRVTRGNSEFTSSRRGNVHAPAAWDEIGARPPQATVMLERGRSRVPGEVGGGRSGGDVVCHAARTRARASGVPRRAALLLPRSLGGEARQLGSAPQRIGWIRQHCAALAGLGPESAQTCLQGVLKPAHLIRPKPDQTWTSENNIHGRLASQPLSSSLGISFPGIEERGTLHIFLISRYRCFCLIVCLGTRKDVRCIALWRQVTYEDSLLEGYEQRLHDERNFPQVPLQKEGWGTDLQGHSIINQRMVAGERRCSRHLIWSSSLWCLTKVGEVWVYSEPTLINAASRVVVQSYAQSGGQA